MRSEKIGASTLYLADCMDLMAQYPDRHFDLAIVDPPYGLKCHGGQDRSHYAKQKNGSLLLVKAVKYAKKDWDNKPTSNKYFDELVRVSKNQIIFGVNYFNRCFGSGRIIWDKCNDKSYHSTAEIAYCSLNNRVDVFRFLWNGMFQGKSMSEGTIQQGNKKLNEAHIHPTQKPVALYKWLLSKYAKQGDKILDTHFGSGSISIACNELGYELVASEIDEDYFNAAVERIKLAAAQGTLDLEPIEPPACEKELIFEDKKGA